MNTVVYNLETLEEIHFTCEPEIAVQVAYAMENNLMTQFSLNGKLLDIPILKGEHFVTCGNWTSRYK